MKRILMLCVMFGAVICGVQGFNDPLCAPASITLDPTSQTNCQGATVTFTVGGLGHRPVELSMAEKREQSQQRRHQLGIYHFGICVAVVDHQQRLCE